MKRTLKFTVNGKPIPKGRPRFWRGKISTPARTRDYEKLCKAAAIKATQGRSWDVAARYSVCLVVYMPDKRRRDLDNVLKSVLDGFNGVTWQDDHQVDFVQAERKLDREAPRVEVLIWYETGEGQDVED